MPSGVPDGVWGPHRSGRSSIFHLLHGCKRAESGLVLCTHPCSVPSTGSEPPTPPEMGSEDVQDMLLSTGH